MSVYSNLFTTLLFESLIWDSQVVHQTSQDKANLKAYERTPFPFSKSASTVTFSPFDLKY